MNYVVIWEFDWEADTPREAAEAAWAAMRVPCSTANVFRVVDEGGIETTVDLQEPEVIPNTAEDYPAGDPTDHNCDGFHRRSLGILEDE